MALEIKAEDIMRSARLVGSTETSKLRTVLSSHFQKRKAPDSDIVLALIKKTMIMTRRMLKKERNDYK